MKTYKVLSESISGPSGIALKGAIISEQFFPPRQLMSLIRANKIIEWVDGSVKPGEKIKLAIVTSVWGRREIVELFVKGVDNLIENCPDFEIQVVVSGSIQNEKNINDKGVQFDFHLNGMLPYITYIEIPNEPLAAKVNATTYACRNLGVNYVICMGSDDIMSPELLNEYAKHMRDGIDFIGVTDCYFYDTISKQSLYWGGYREDYRKGHTCGAFRALSANLLAQWDWMPWENKDSRVLDKSMQDKLKVTDHSFHSFSMKEKGLFGLDIKSSTNMTPFAQWDNSEFIDTDIIKQQFPYIF
jgi:hypothetical protein